MSKPKLTYFDFPGGRGEDCRLALHLADVDFEDDRIKGSDWPALKPETPFGALPVLHIAGQAPLGESNVILTLIGRRHDLLPKDDFAAAQHQAIMGSVEDMRARLGPSLRMKDEAEKKAAREDFAENYLPLWAQNLEAKIQGPFIGGDEISVADIKVHTAVKWLSGGVDHVPADALGSFPKLLALTEAVKSHPKVVDWYSR